MPGGRAADQLGKSSFTHPPTNGRTSASQVRSELCVMYFMTGVPYASQENTRVSFANATRKTLKCENCLTSCEWNPMNGESGSFLAGNDLGFAHQLAQGVAQPLRSVHLYKPVGLDLGTIGSDGDHGFSWKLLL